jgi:hypothetical protein
MTKKNYNRGYVEEVRCRNDLKKGGYWAERAHASKNTFDVVAVDKNGDLVRFIQVKRSMSNIVKVDSFLNRYREDIEKMATIPGSSHVSRELWVWIDAQKSPKGICKSKDECPLHFELPHAMKGECSGCRHFKQTVNQKAAWRKFRVCECKEPKIYEIETGDANDRHSAL